MAAPRRVVAGETHLITRRCYQRTFRLRPSHDTNRIFLYCLGYAVKKTGVLLHAVSVMSNHHHLVLTDPHGVLPIFLREFHRMTAKVMNTLQRECENLWAAQPCSVVRLGSDFDVDDKIAYVITNPVAAGLVERPDAWPGVTAWGDRTLTVRRPAAYFSNTGTCPAEITFSLVSPPVRNADRSEDESRNARISRLIASKVEAALAAARAVGRRFLGSRSSEKAGLLDRPRTSEQRRRSVPRVASRQAPVRDHLRRVERDFRALYREARTNWRLGDRATVFPFGTWFFKVFHGAAIGPPPAH